MQLHAFRSLFIVIIAGTIFLIVLWSELRGYIPEGGSMPRKGVIQENHLPSEYTSKYTRANRPDVDRVIDILRNSSSYSEIIERDTKVTCQYPLHDPFDEQSMKHFTIQELKCDKTDAGLVTMNADGYLKATNLHNQSCSFVEIKRSNQRLEYSGKTPIVGSVRPSSDFVRVDCSDKKGNVVFRNFFSYAQPHKNIRQYKKTSELSVAVVGIGLMSRLHFMRQMPLSYNYLKTQLGSIEMLGFHQVGLGSHPNLMAMLKGRLGFTQFRLIWEYFFKAGAATMYADDGQTISSPRKNFTHHFENTFWSAILNSSKKQRSSRFCLGERPNYTVHLNYLLSFARSYRNKLKFMFSLYSELSHSFNMVQVMDEGFRDFFSSMKNEGLLDKTVLFVMSDQGTPMTGITRRRETIESVAEEAMPLLSIILPPAAPEHWRISLMNNRKKLTSFFDLFQTFVDIFELLNPSKLVMRQLRSVSSGKSLFHHISNYRTCVDAQIPDHLCMCANKMENIM